MESISVLLVEGDENTAGVIASRLNSIGHNPAGVCRSLDECFRAYEDTMADPYITGMDREEGRIVNEAVTDHG